MTAAVNAHPPSPAETPGLHGLPYTFRFFSLVAARIATGTLTVTVPDGRRFEFSGGQPGPHGHLLIRDFNVLNRLLRGGSLGFAEGYLAGEWDSPDVAELLEMAARNTERLREFLSGKPLVRWMNRALHVLNRNTRSGSRRNIMAHYDLGNAFYRRWLDPSMTYSSARYAHPTQELSDAQRNKYLALAALMDLKADQHVLEIGCGWGGFAEFAAKEFGAKITAITISREQYDFAKRRMFERGLADRADIQLRDYRDVEGEFDRIASIEMFEAVGEAYWPAYFQKVRSALKPGGRAGLQIITIDDAHFAGYRTTTDFIQKYVFPGGMLPSPTALKEQVTRAGLTWQSHVMFGQDYAHTLAAWRERFLLAWDDIKALGFDERFKRLWTYYLSYCEGGFRAGAIDVTQVALARP